MSKSSQFSIDTPLGAGQLSFGPFSASRKRFIAIMTAASLTVTMAGGSTNVFKQVPVGAFLPIQVTRLHAGPTYLDIIALF